jgi:hypothetical protein
MNFVVASVEHQSRKIGDMQLAEWALFREHNN